MFQERYMLWRGADAWTKLFSPQSEPGIYELAYVDSEFLTFAKYLTIL